MKLLQSLSEAEMQMFLAALRWVPGHGYGATNERWRPPGRPNPARNEASDETTKNT